MRKLDRLERDILNIAVELTSARFLEKGAITELLKNLCELENIDIEISLKKWRLAMLEEIMDNLSHNCIYDLIELTDFWVSWGNPKNKPHLIQGLDSSISPNKYYTEKNLEKLLKAHQAWIIEEKQKINKTIDLMTELEKLIESNAKAIAALTSNIQEMKRDRDLMYTMMRDLTDKVSSLVSSQARSYELMENLDARQNQLSNQQQQLIDILKRLSD